MSLNSFFKSKTIDTGALYLSRSDEMILPKLVLPTTLSFSTPVFLHLLFCLPDFHRIFPAFSFSFCSLSFLSSYTVTKTVATSTINQLKHKATKTFNSQRSSFF